MCLIRDHNMWNQKKEGLCPDSIQSVSVFCPCYLSIPLCLRQTVIEIFNYVVIGTLIPLFKVNCIYLSGG